MQNLDILKPKSMNDLISSLNEATKDSNILAGGTDLVISLNEECFNTDLIIDISGLECLNYVSMDNDIVSIGAVTPFSCIEKNEIIINHAKCLAEASAGIGSTQIRNIGTIGGNIANASPAGDCITALVALDATVEILDSNGRYTEMKICDLIEGPGVISLKEDQVITGIKFIALDNERKSYFTKIGNRKTVTIARINLTVIIKKNSDSIVEDIRIVLGAVGKKSFRDLKTENLVKGMRTGDEFFETLEHGLKNTIEASIPDRKSMPYKRAAVKGLVSNLAERI